MQPLGLGMPPILAASLAGHRVRKLVPRLLARVRLARFGACAVGRGRVCLLWTFAYLMARNLFALVWLLARPRRSKELEILLCVMSWRCYAGMLAGRG
jgi:hypothetical protein